MNRTNIVFSDENWRRLQQVPKGERSRFVNQAVGAALLKQQRLEAVRELDALKKQMKPLPGNSEDWIREDRASH